MRRDRQQQALGLTQAAGASLSPVGTSIPSASAFLNNLVQTENGQFGSFQSTWQQLALESPQQTAALQAWAQSTDGQYQFLAKLHEQHAAGGREHADDRSGRHVQRSRARARRRRRRRAPIFRSPGRPPPRRRLSILPALTVRPGRARRRPTRPARTAARAPARPRRRRRARILRSPERPPPRRRRSTLPALIAWQARARRRPIRLGRSVRRAPARPRWRRPAHIFLSQERLLQRQSLSTLLALTVWRARARLLLRSPGIMSRQPARAARRRTIPAITRRMRARRRRSWRCRRPYRARQRGSLRLLGSLTRRFLPSRLPIRTSVLQTVSRSS